MNGEQIRIRKEQSMSDITSWRDWEKSYQDSEYSGQISTEYLQHM